MTSINEQLENENEVNDFGKRNGGSDLFFKFKEGENRIRVLTLGLAFGQHFVDQKFYTCYGVSKGCPFHEENYLGNKVLSDEEKKNRFNLSSRYSTYILDKADNTVKLADIPYSVYKKLGELQEDEDYAFDTFPMPYDVKVTFKKKEADGTKTSPGNMYSIVPSPKREEISAEVSQILNEKMEKYPIKDLIQKKKDEQRNAHSESGVLITPEMHKESYDKRTAEINTGKAKMPTV